MVDKWVWRLDSCGGYSVKSGYDFVMGFSNSVSIQAFKNLWQSFAPSSVKAFMWKLFWGRVQTRQNLALRGVQLSGSSVSCPFCYDAEESVEHLFFCCQKVSGIWYSCFDWLGYRTVLPMDCQLHFNQCIHGFWSKKQCRIWWTVWGACVWTIWCLRNKAVFSNENPDWANVLGVIQWRAWLWCSSSLKEFRNSISEWILDPGACISQI